MKKYKVVGIPKMQYGGPGDKKDPDNFTNEELTDYGNMQINVGDSDQGYYGDKHRRKTNKIYTSLNQLKKLFTEGQLNAVNGEWDYDNQIDAQGIYDDEAENLIKRYQGLEDLMKLNFGDRKGDPTKATDWMNRDGRRYRKSLRALESDIQDLYLRRMEQYGKNTGVTSYGDNVQYDYVKSTDPEDKIYDDVTGEWTGEYRDKAIPRKLISYDGVDIINDTTKGIKSQFKRSPLNTSNVNDRRYIAQQIAENGYVPKQYSLDSQDAVVYAKDRDKKRQEKLTAEAEKLFIQGAKQGYLPLSVVPIGGTIDDLKSFIKDQKKNLWNYSKNKDDVARQKQKDAKFLNVSTDLLGTVEGEKLVRERLKTASDEDQRFLVNLYQKYFSDYDPNAVQFTQEEVNEMQEGFKGKARGSKELDYLSLDNPTGVIQDIAAATAYAAPAIGTGQAFLNPTIQNILTPYFFYETTKEDGILDQAVDEFAKGEYWDGTVDATFGLLDVFAMKGLMKTLKTPGAVTKLFSKLKSKNLPKGYLEKINTSLPPMLQLDNIDDVPKGLLLPSAANKALPQYTVPKSFKSEIDWARWNKDIPNNKPLMDEYRAIEHNTKQDGTWMKNPDGTPFDGNKEQFVQQQSENFKKAFGDTKVVDREGNPLILHHGSERGIPNEFVPPKQRGVPGEHTDANMNYSYFHHDKDIAAEYAANFNPRENNYENVASVYINSKNPLINRNVSDPEKYIKNTDLSKYDAVSSRPLGKEYDFDKLDKFSIPFEESEIAVPFGNNVKSAIGNDGMFDMTNPDIYKSVLPLVGAAGAAAAAAGDEDLDASMMAALPLMIFGRGKKINLKNVYKNIRNFFKTVPALKNVPFKQSELQSSVLKNLPAKFKKEFGPDVTFEQLVEKQPEMLKDLIVEHIVKRYTYYEGYPTAKEVNERELPIFYAEQDEAAQFALDFNTAWMEGSLDPRSKELIKPVKDGIKEARELEEDIVNFKPFYDDAIEGVRDGIQSDWNWKVLFPGNTGAASKEEAVKIGKDLLKVYKDAAAKVVGTDNAGNYDKLIKNLEDDIRYISTMGIDTFRKLQPRNFSTYSFTEMQAEEFINANSDIVYDYYDLKDKKDAAYDKIMDQIDAIGSVENVLAPDIAERVNALRSNVQDILDTSKAATLEARGEVNKKSIDGDIISGLVEGRYSESDLKGTVGESMKGDYQGFYGVKSTTDIGNVGQITKRGLPANSENLDELYTMYEKGFLRDKLKGLVVRQKDMLRQPIDVAGTMAHEDKHIYQSLIGYLDPHVESQIYGYDVADQKSDLGKAIQEVLVEPKKVDDPTATVDAGDSYTDETYQASPIEVDANLQKERVKYAYKKFQEIVNTDNPASKFKKLKESAGSDARYQKAVIEEIVRVMKIPENKAQFIEDLMSSPVGNAVNQHFKQKYKGVIDPLTDDTKTMAGKEVARQFLEMLPALLIGAGLTTEFANSESSESSELMSAGILGFATRGKIKGLSKFRGVIKTPLTFKSFMPNGKIMNLAKDKMGRIPTEQALAILNKEGSGAYKSITLKEALKTKFNGKVPSKIDPEVLKNLAEETIIPLNLEVVDKKSTVSVDPEFGFDYIGYRDPKQQAIIGRNLTSNAEEAAIEEARIATQQAVNDRAEKIKELEEEMDNLEDTLENFDDYEDKGYFPTGTRPSEFKKQLEEVTKKYEALMADKPPHNLENNTILFDSDALPGLGRDDHSSGVNNLAHVHYTVRSDSPDTFTVTQFQSDFFQDRDKILQNRLNQTDENLNRNIKSQQDHIDAQQKIIDEGEMLPDGNFRTANGEIISKYLIDNQGLGPSLEGLKGAQSFKANKEGIKVLQKTWESRTLQETVDYAARNGQTKFRFPTGETASKLQNYGDDVTEAIKTGSKEKLVKIGDEEKLQITKRYEKIYPKLIEKIYGVKPRKVSDAQGNSWYEFDIPEDIIEGTRDIIAYKEGGQVKRKLKIPNPQFEELELTKKEALAYAQKGYIVEEID